MPRDTFLSALFLATLAIGCGKPDPGPAPPGSGSAATIGSRPLTRYGVEPFGAATFVLEVKSGLEPRPIKGIAKTFSGELEIDPEDLTRTRGSVTVDLAVLETLGFGDDEMDREVTGRARDWLEVGALNLKEPLRLARFTIRTIDEVSAKNLATVDGDKRTVNLKATGELEVHGVKQVKQVELVAIFAYAQGVPTRVTIKTETPFVVNLPAHDVKPRGSQGEDLAGKPLGAAGAARADEVSVSLEVSAKSAAGK